jgi:hypothetical protein
VAVADEIKLHTDRAVAELDRAAACPVAARPRLALPERHRKRMRELSGAQAPANAR